MYKAFGSFRPEEPGTVLLANRDSKTCLERTARTFNEEIGNFSVRELTEEEVYRYVERQYERNPLREKMGELLREWLEAGTAGGEAAKNIHALRMQDPTIWSAIHTKENPQGDIEVSVTFW
jgi:hypothetical protein